MARSKRTDAPEDREDRLTYLRRALVEMEKTGQLAEEAGSWGPCVQARSKCVQIRSEIEEIEQTQAARDAIVRTLTAEEYFDELLATVRAMRSGAMAAGSHVAAVSSIKLEGELVAQRAAASERAAQAARELMTDDAIEAEIARLRSARGVYGAEH